MSKRLCKAEVFKRLFGIFGAYGPAEIDDRARDAAKAFLRMDWPG